MLTERMTSNSVSQRKKLLAGVSVYLNSNMEKKITLTVSVNGNAVSREYVIPEEGFDTNEVWALRIESMLDTLSMSNEEKF